MKLSMCFKERRLEASIQKVLPMLCLLLSLTACGTHTTVPYTEERLLVPPDELLVLSSVEPPPTKEAFLKLSMNERLALLGRLYMIQTKNTSSCNIQLTNLTNWIADTKARIGSKGRLE